jgi:hypothetical protein
MEKSRGFLEMRQNDGSVRADGRFIEGEATSGWGGEPMRLRRRREVAMMRTPQRRFIVSAISVS